MSKRLKSVSKMLTVTIIIVIIIIAGVGGYYYYTTTIPKKTALLTPPQVSATTASVTIGQTASFSGVVTSGVAPYKYQWFEQSPNGVITAISGAISPSYTFIASNTTETGVWHFILEVTDSLGTSANSSQVALTVSPVASKGALKIAVLLPGVQTDLSWDEAAYDSGVATANYFRTQGYTVTFSVAQGIYTAEEIAPVVQTYLSEGYQVLIGAGYEFEEPFAEYSPQYPNVLFLQISGIGKGANYQLVIPNVGESAFIAGVQAALMSKDHIVASIGGENVGTGTWSAVGFELGVKYADQNFLNNINTTVITTFVGNFNDPVGAQSASASAVASGADVLFTSGDGITEGVAEEAGIANVPFIYSLYNATLFDPPTTVGGSTFSLAPQFEYAITDWLTNKTVPAASGASIDADLSNGGITIQLTSLTPSNITTILNNLTTAVRNGQIVIYAEAANGSLYYNPVTPSYNSLFG
ncbi:MAG: BMP family ABC transporter substrate-binding protein [Nitrososphaerota archaeon]|jgi:basic membrane lipoprotein Med (substrate-binding protein (PBP1-ABC) superfamily)|nr:BMP family ABC transporter substrate-binding protein [Nitrososphaerota archaeon]MDG7041325.1 BMP family ABC transporter substrate-binding protein [Nitrososphaerota archaeon]MDG7045704.1 BMP family ABC transporter substrate-binding protein [Nitrososphaerota archaeon]